MLQKPLTSLQRYDIDTHYDDHAYDKSRTSYYRRGALCRSYACCLLIVVSLQKDNRKPWAEARGFFYCAQSDKK